MSDTMRVAPLERDALIDELHLSIAESVARANVSEPWVLLDVIQYAAALMSPGQLRDLTAYVNRYADHPAEAASHE